MNFPEQNFNLDTEIRFSTDERSTSRSNQEVSILPPKFTSTISKENRNQTISNREQTNSNNQSFTIPDEIDKIRSEKNQGKIQIGQWCYEINVGTAVEPPTLSAVTDHGKTKKDFFLFLFDIFLQSHRQYKQVHQL